MPFSQTADVFAQFDIPLNSWVILDEKPVQTPTGWDELTQRLLGYFPTWAANPASLMINDSGYSQGDNPLGMSGSDILDFFVTSLEINCIDGPFFEGTLSCKGRISNKVKLRRFATEVTHTVDEVQIGANLFGRTEVTDGAPGIEITQFVFGSDPNTNLVGTAQTPSPAPAIPSALWASIADPTYHYPNGWVLVSADTDELPGVSASIAHLSIQRYEYRWAWTP